MRLDHDDLMQDWDAAFARAQVQADRLNRRDTWIILVVAVVLWLAILLA